MNTDSPLVIVGAGPAGLAAAHQAVQQGLRPLVLEKTNKIGGLARTETYKGCRFDIGGHRFLTKVKEVDRLWQEMLGEGFLKVTRLSRIYYQGRFFSYPLEPLNALTNLGAVEAVRILLSYFRYKVQPLPAEDTFEQWVINRFGQRLYETFFQAYTEKVWGIPCSEIQADWAAQRIKGLSLRSAVSQAFFGNNKNVKTLITEFQYPRLGPGMMWQRFREKVESKGGQVWDCAEAVRLDRDGGRITGVVTERNGDQVRVSAEHFISSMPLPELVLRLDPLPPAEVVQAARQLRYRDFTLVGLIANCPDPFRDNWIYVHDPAVRVGRIQNFRNWSAAMVPDPGTTSLGMEYFCSEGDTLWRMSDADLIDLATQELAHLGLANADDVVDGLVIRQPKAYPIYDSDYPGSLKVIRRFLATMDNLQTIGRSGLHRYNNMDHSMLTGLRAVDNIGGQENDLWAIGDEPEYLEGGSLG